MYLVDLHTHVLPGIDDGARTMEEALQMLQNAQASYVAALAATPHCNAPGFPANHYDANFLQRLRNLRNAAQQAGISVQIMTGMEVRANEELFPLLEEGKVLTINGGRYLLTEFGMFDTPETIESLLARVQEAGYIPLIAHPERYAALWQKPETAAAWLEMGCHLQLTGGSVLGKFGTDAQRTSRWLLKNQMVACIASDAHGIRSRTNFLMEVYDHLSLYYSKAYAQALLLETPLAIAQNQLL